MAKIILGLVIGTALGAVGAILLQYEKLEIVLRKIETLSEQNKQAREKIKTDSQQLVELKQKNEKLQTEIKQMLGETQKAKFQIAKLEEQLVKAKSAHAARSGPKPDSPDKTKPGPKDEETKKLAEAIRKYQKILQVGQPLSEEAVKELDIDEITAARINELLKDEGDRANKALTEFCLNNLSNPPENIIELTPQELILRLLPEISGEFNKLSQLSKEDKLALQKGEKDLLDFLPRDSRLMTLAHSLHQVRQETYRQLERELPEDKMEALRENYLPPNDFVFPGNLNLAFGKVDWEKER